MSDDDAVAASIQTNRLTVHDPSHLPSIIGANGRLFGQQIRLDTGDGWVAISPADGGVVVERIDAPERNNE